MNEEIIDSYLQRFESIEAAENWFRNHSLDDYYFRLDDDTFPLLIKINVGRETAELFEGETDETEWKKCLACDLNDAASECLISSPFILWSDKLHTCFGHVAYGEYCGNLDDSEKEFEDCFIQLIKAYDIPKIVEETVEGLFELRGEIEADISRFRDLLVQAKKNLKIVEI